MTKRRPTEDELALWRHVASGVRPLGRHRSKKQSALTTPDSQSVGAKPKNATAATDRTPTQQRSSAVASPPAPKALGHGSIVDLDRRQADRFRKGKMKIDGRLDLHGHTQAEAHQMLNGFLKRTQARGGRCVLVITGKGMTAGKNGVLKQSVPRWLNEPMLRHMVLAFDHATMKDGGEGALYVLLKRLK